MSALPNLHAALVHFPVALFVSAFVCDVALLSRFRLPWLDRAGVLMYVGAALTAGASAVSGKLAANSFDARLDDTVRAAVATHEEWAFFSVVILFGVAALRFDVMWRDRDEPRPRVHRPRWLALGAALVGLSVLTTTALRGGELVYQFGVGVSTSLP